MQAVRRHNGAEHRRPAAEQVVRDVTGNVGRHRRTGDGPAVHQADADRRAQRHRVHGERSRSAGDRMDGDRTEGGRRGVVESPRHRAAPARHRADAVGHQAAAEAPDGWRGKHRKPGGMSGGRHSR